MSEEFEKKMLKVMRSINASLVRIVDKMGGE